MGNVLTSVLIAFALTVVTESVILVFMKNRREWLRAGFLCNAITNPVLNVLMLLVTYFTKSGAAHLVVMLLLELVVVFLEAFFYERMLGYERKTCMKASVFCNLFSFLIGAAWTLLLVSALSPSASTLDMLI